MRIPTWLSSRRMSSLGVVLGMLLLLFALPDVAFAQTAGGGSGMFGNVPGIDIAGDEDFELPVQILLLLTVLSLAPAIIILMTSFTRLVVVFSILRTALGTQQSPPTQVIIGLSLFLTMFIMYPVLENINDNALQPYLDDQITQKEAFDRAVVPMKK
ncbi:MAG: flagellar biosynthetic protein FliP, partial [Bacteroidota bacterium]